MFVQQCILVIPLKITFKLDRFGALSAGNSKKKNKNKKKLCEMLENCLNVSLKKVVQTLKLMM